MEDLADSVDDMNAVGQACMATQLGDRTVGDLIDDSTR
jgi:hypothetical protein